MNVYQNIDNIITDLSELEEQQMRLMYQYADTFFPMSIKKNDSKKLVVFFPGAFDRSVRIPKFQRESYFQDLPYNCISLFDPTLFLNKTLRIAWFQGTYQQNYTLYIADILKSIINKTGILNEDILFFGTSAGCIPALKVSEYFAGANVFMGNAQTDILEYVPAFVKKILSVSYDGVENIDIYHHRMNILNYSGLSKIFYAQNIEDDFHYKNHYLPFINTLINGSCETVVYNHKTGHSPLPRNYELNAIRSILENQSFSEVYKPILVEENNE